MLLVSRFVRPALQKISGSCLSNTFGEPYCVYVESYFSHDVECKVHGEVLNWESLACSHEAVEAVQEDGG